MPNPPETSRDESTTPDRIRVVVIDDSLVAREMLAQILASDTGIEVVGMATNGREGAEMVERLRPDLATMDIHMPEMDGLAATERIMAYTPTPILVVSSSVYGEGMGRAFDALTAGALEVVKKPEARDWADLERIGRAIIRSVKVLSRVHVVTHIAGRQGSHAAAPAVPAPAGLGKIALVAIGSSTGGPSALEAVIGGLPRGFPVPVVVTQHIADGFIPGLVSWLAGSCALSVKAAEDGEPLRAGTVYLAPTGANVEIEGERVQFSAPKPGQLYVPSADTLFESVARTYGRRAVGVILTGMGADGASGLKRMRERGAATIAQDEPTSVVWGMPRAAVELEAAGTVLPLGDISRAIVRLVAGSA
jgi:two-component system chemotaxis response regulator CheB